MPLPAKVLPPSCRGARHPALWRTPGEETMTRTLIISTIVALTLSAAHAADMAASMPMPGMVMKMIDPMPAVYMGEADKPGAPMFKGLGTHRHKITTRNARTQLLFDQGVN